MRHEGVQHGLSGGGRGPQPPGGPLCVLANPTRTPVVLLFEDLRTRGGMRLRRFLVYEKETFPRPLRSGRVSLNNVGTQCDTRRASRKVRKMWALDMASAGPGLCVGDVPDGHCRAGA